MKTKIKDTAFLETGAFLLSKFGNEVCGDTIMTRRIKEENRYVAVLSDGLGSGIRANVLSSLTASMALNFTLRHEPVRRTAETIMQTLPVDNRRNISYSTFTIIDIDFSGEAVIVEYDNPRLMIIRDNEAYYPNREPFFVQGTGGEKKLWQSAWVLKPDDRLILVSDGVIQSGIGGQLTPFGWEEDGFKGYVLALLENQPDISARDLAKKIVLRSKANDHLEPKDDISAMVFYYRQPRRMLICSGPPYDNGRDSQLASSVSDFQGIKVICGGTTAQIISRELNRPVSVTLSSPQPGVPPQASMAGVDLITEGILTLGKLGETLESGAFDEIPAHSPVALMSKYILDSDIIEFIVGTRINQAHQDPALPVELEIRRNIIKRIARILEEKYLKEVVIHYL